MILWRDWRATSRGRREVHEEFGKFLIVDGRENGEGPDSGFGGIVASTEEDGVDRHGNGSIEREPPEKS